MKTPNIHTTHTALPQIYAYTTPQVPSHNGWLKIGYTERQSVEERIKQQCHTANIAWHLEWSGNAVYENSTETFHDTDFHAYLTKEGYQRQPGTEWFHINANEARMLFYDFRQNRGVVEGKHTQSYQLRDSQALAVSRTIDSFRNHPKKEFLWNAKPRFGKTLAVYDLCMRMGLTNVLVVTNRPAIADSWYDDYLKFVGTGNYLFVSHVGQLLSRKQPCLTRRQYLEHIKQPGSVKRCIEFVSLQDLKGSIYFGGDYDKLDEVAHLTWDLLVIDEAHEGVDTYKTDVAFDQIKRRHTLHLSGTPFKALATEKFDDDAIFNWTYADECRAREQWDESRGDNPYAAMPRLNMYTYRMSDIVIDKARRGIDIDGSQEDYAFDLNEFFRVENGRFVHDEAVDKWLDALTRQPRYPFSTPALRQELRHSFWLLNRVDSAKKLALKLSDTKRHPEFADYEIVVAAGDGKYADDEAVEWNDDSLDRVKQAIAKHPQGTITLSVGQLTTGVTIPQWTAVLILSNMKSPAQYMQAAFRAQTPYLYKGADGTYHRKENAYVFDFDPARTLTNYETMANGLTADTASGGGDTDTRKRHIRELLNFFPVIGEDENGEMMPLDAEAVMLIPRKIRSKEVVRSGFMSNFLFDNISNVYGCPTAVIDIINQFPATKAPKDSEVNADDVEELSHNVDADGQPQTDADKVKAVQDSLFGEKIYADTGKTIDDFVHETIERHNEEKRKRGKSAEEQLIDAVSSRLSTLLIGQAKQNDGNTLTLSKRNEGRAALRIKQHVKAELGEACHSAEIENKKIDHQLVKDCEGKTTQQQDDLKREAAEKKKLVDEKLHKAISEKTRSLVEQSANIIADTQEQQRIDNKKSNTDEQVRDHLRGFARTIPSFLMAYGNEQTTLQKFDEDIPDSVFREVTSVSKEQFHLLRDGGDFRNPKTGAVEHSPGHFFDEVVFNDSVREFMSLRHRLADYFDPKMTEDIFNYIPPQKTNQIFTPKDVVKRMVDMLEQENPGCFDDPTKTFADLYMKSGQYITEIVRRLFNSEGMRRAYPDDEARLRHIFKHQVYGLAPTECIYRIATRYILGFSDHIRIADSDHHLRMADSLPAAKEGRMQELIDRVFGS